MTTNTTQNGHPNPTKIREAMPQIYDGLGAIRDEIGAPHLLKEARDRTDTLFALLTHLTELIEYRQLGDIQSLKETIEAGRKAMAEEAVEKVETVPEPKEVRQVFQSPEPKPRAVAVPNPSPKPKAEPEVKPVAIHLAATGRPPNMALREFLAGDRWQNLDNWAIAKKFGIHVNTVRRAMRELGLKRTKNFRRIRVIEVPTRG